MFTESEAKQFITVQHAHYFAVLREFCLSNKLCGEIRIPEIHVVDAVFRACGQYNWTRNVCEYSLPFCVFDGAQYADTMRYRTRFNML
jgi:hypothetical protein